MLVLCSAILAIGLNGNSATVQSLYDGFIEPKVQHDIEVRQRRLSDNIELENNTRLFMSATITSLDERAETLVPHVGVKVADVVPVLSDDRLIGPQGSLLSGGWSTVMQYGAPNGRNALVSVITSGIQDLHALTPEEYALWRHLFARTLADQYVIPIINWACGIKFDSKETVGIVAGLITGHNSQIIEQGVAVLKTGSPSEFGYFMWQLVVREIETGGPIASYFARKYGKNLAAEFAKRLAEKAIIRTIPGANAIDVFLSIVNTGGTFANFVPSAWDMMTVPAKLEYRAYFIPGIGDVYPKVLRIDGKDDEITLAGHKLVPIPGKVFKVTVSEKGRGRIFESSDLRTTIRGHSVSFTLPESAIGNRKGPLTYAMTIDKMEVKCPEETQIIQDLRVLRLEPDRGPPGTRVRIYADGLQPYIITNKVRIQAPGALTAESGMSELVSKKWVEFTVPDLFVDRPTVHSVYIEEEFGGNRKESRKLPFTVETGTDKERAERNREWTMPEVKFSIRGVLDDSTPARSHLFDVPAGMQVDVELAEVYGPEGDNMSGELEYWSLYYLTSKRGEPLTGVAVADRHTEVKSGQPAQRMTHTTGSHPVQNLYGVSLKKKSRQAVRYRFNVSYFRRDDAGSGRDAGDNFDRSLRIRNNERLSGQLSAEKRRIREDLKDIYRIDGIADDKEILVRITGANTTHPYRNKEGSVKSVRLYCMQEGQSEPYPVLWHEEPLNSSSTEFTLIHTEAGNRSYFLEFEAGEANASYTMEVTVRPTSARQPPPPPVKSTFDQNDEGWLLGGNFKTELSRPQYHSINPRDGYVYASDASPEETIGPMDLLIAVDTTGSMGNVIQSVKDSTVRIIDELRRRTSSLQIGLVNFKDVAADRATGRTIVPLSANVEQVLANVRSWTASGGGGDGPEDLLHALKGALQSDWRTVDPQGRKVSRVVIAITDVPPKTNASGADFEGNSLLSIGNLADRLGARIFPVIVSADGGALAAAEELAAASGGKTLQLADQSKAADALLEASFAAIDPSSPMYWIAPAKFLGDKSRFQGRTLAFSMYSFSSNLKSNEPFAGDDVILEGGGLSISLAGGVRPNGNVLYSTFIGFSVPLDARGNWVETASRRKVSDTQITQVLKNLSTLKIRADYNAGTDSSQFDNVILGSTETPTHRGLDENAKKLFGLLERWQSMSLSIWKDIDAKWTTYESDQIFEKAFIDRIGTLGGRLAHMRWTSTINLTWIAVTTPGVRAIGFHEVEKLIGKELSRISESGTATVEELAEKRRRFESWRKFATTVEGQLRNLMRIALDIAANEERMLKATGAAYQSLLDATTVLHRRFDEANRGLRMEAEATLGDWR